MKRNPIELAYAAHMYVPTDKYRHGRRRKMYNPIRTTPALVQAMLHLGPQKMDLHTVRQRGVRAVQEPEAAAYLQTLDWEELVAFLDTIAVFLKAGPQGRKERGMEKFENKDEQVLTSKQVSEQAHALLKKIRGEVNKNKLQQMAAHVTAAQDKWEALAALARFYPRNGIPKLYVDALVRGLEITALRSFKQVVAQSLIFYRAEQVEEEV